MPNTNRNTNKIWFFTGFVYLLRYQHSFILLVARNSHCRPFEGIRGCLLAQLKLLLVNLQNATGRDNRRQPPRHDQGTRDRHDSTLKGCRLSHPEAHFVSGGCSEALHGGNGSQAIIARSQTCSASLAQKPNRSIFGRQCPRPAHPQLRKDPEPRLTTTHLRQKISYRYFEALTSFAFITL